MSDVVFALEGSVINLGYLNKIKSWMEDIVKEEENLDFTSTRLVDVEYNAKRDYYTFTLEFLNEG